jgi:beta-phosphoglucomutase-like phosphatase (HAD superfamily)
MDQIGGALFAIDGVVLDTERVHVAAWKRSLDEHLRHRGHELGRTFAPFAVPEDYLRYIDSEFQLEGVRSFLASRGLVEDDAVALLERKTRYFLEEVERYGVAAFPDAIALLRELRARGAQIGAFGTIHATRVARAGNVERLLDVRVDVQDLTGLCDTWHVEFSPERRLHLLLEAARRIGLPPGRLAAVDDSPLGVDAARRAGFAVVLGLHRDAVPWRPDRDAALHRQGAHVVVRSLFDVTVTGRVSKPSHRTVHL